MKLHQSKAFTLVELIVVITILAILATIAFLSFQGYSKQTRDTSRVADMRNIASGLSIFFSKNGNYPQPDNSININASGTILGYQGYLGSGAMNLIKLGGKGIDPLDSTYYTYYLGTNNKIQLLGYLEQTKESIGITSYTNKIKETYAGSVDYTKRNVYTIGSKLGILLQSGSLVPAQDNLSNTFTGVDIVNTNSGYLAYTSNTDTPITGTGNALSILNPTASCKTILDNGLGKTDGVYTINPQGGAGFSVYCDMTTNGGGRTQIVKDSSTSLTDLSKFGDSSYITSTFYNNPTYGIGWGTNDRYFKTYILNKISSFNEIRIKYTGRYDGTFYGYFMITTLNGANGYYWDQTMPPQGNILLALADGNTIDSIGQTLIVNDITIFSSVQNNVINREDILNGYGKYITMTGYTSSYGYNKRYIGYLYVR